MSFGLSSPGQMADKVQKVFQVYQRYSRNFRVIYLPPFVRDYKEHGGKRKDEEGSLRRDGATASTPSLSSWGSRYCLGLIITYLQNYSEPSRSVSNY